MPRQRSPERDRAFAVFQEYQGKIANREIAKRLGIPEKTISGWKVKDSWVDQMNGVLQTRERSTPNRRPGAPKGSRNAAGNIGGGPTGNSKAVTHGFFRRIFPHDDETLGIIESIVDKGPLQILWENIVIQYTAIARAQRIMFVENKEDHTQVLKRRKDSDMTEEREWEYQFSWDKHANFLQAQSRAISTLEGLVARYESMLPDGLTAEKKRLELQKIKVEIAKITDLDDGKTIVVNLPEDYGDYNDDEGD